MSSKDENKDLEMYIKYAVLKFLQCVTYSRHNYSKLQTDSKILLGVVSADWFNLCIPDNSEVLEEVKTLFGGRTIELSQPICIEIYLKTPDSETMTIEYWWIYKTSKTIPKDICGKVTFYNSLTTLLKSLLLTTRATPGYAIARNQPHTSIKLQHCLTFGEPCSKLSENFKKHLIGIAPSPIGTVEIQVAWKNKLLLDVKSVSQVSGTVEDSQINLITHLTINKNLILRGNTKIAQATDEEILPAGKKAAFGSPLDTHFMVDSIRDEVPFSSLLKYANSNKISESLSNPSDDGIDIITDQITQEHPRENITPHFIKPHDDFVMIEPNYPFASQEELIKFYQEFQDAPPLNMFENDFPLEPLESILEQIAHFEMNAEQINEFVNSLERLSDA